MASSVSGESVHFVHSCSGCRQRFLRQRARVDDNGGLDDVAEDEERPTRGGGGWSDGRWGRPRGGEWRHIRGNREREREREKVRVG